MTVSSSRLVFSFGISVFFSPIHLFEDFGCNVKRGVRRRHATIDGGLQQDLFDLVARHSIVKGGFHMHAEFVATIQSDHHRECQQTASMAGQAGARPYFAPGVAGDEVLEIAVEIGGCGHGAVHVFVAENGAPDFHALLVAFCRP